MVTAPNPLLHTRTHASCHPTHPLTWCQVMWQWKGHTPALSVTNRSATQPAAVTLGAPSKNTVPVSLCAAARHTVNSMYVWNTEQQKSDSPIIISSSTNLNGKLLS